MKKSLAKNTERITATELADYIYESRRQHLGYDKIEPSDKSDKETGKRAHLDLAEKYNQLIAHKLFSSEKTTGLLFLPASIMLLSWNYIGTYIAVILLAASSILFANHFYSMKKCAAIRKELGIGEGKIVYSDLDSYGEVLHSRALPLSGKPDAIKKTGLFSYAPIEHKSGVALGYPYLHHQVQLLANCVLVEDNFGKVNHGIISYANGSFEIEYNAEKREIIRELMNKLKADRLLGRSKCPHGSLKKCFRCAFASVLSVTWKKTDSVQFSNKLNILNAGA